MKKQEIFTLHLLETTDECNDYFDERLTSEYGTLEEAQKNAMELAKELSVSEPGYCFCISVVAGEYRNERGDIWGNPDDVWTISSRSKEATIKARKEAYFSNPEVDAYAVCVKNWDVIKQTYNEKGKNTLYKVDSSFETLDDAMEYIYGEYIPLIKAEVRPWDIKVGDWFIRCQYKDGNGICWLAVNTVTEQDKWHQWMNTPVFV